MDEAPSVGDKAEEFRGLFADMPALRSWFNSALPKVYSFVYVRCGGMREVAKDIGQETFLEVVRRRNEFDGRSEPLTWVLGIARHKVADYYRRLYRENRRQLELIEQQDRPQPDAISEIDTRDAVLAALQQLPETQRAVVALHYLDGLGVKEIANQFGRSEHAVESLLARGRAAFKRAYFTEGDDQ